MLRNLFRIWIKPKDTLDRLLFEGNMKQSWAGTWLIVVLSICSSMLSFLLPSRGTKLGETKSLMEQIMPSFQPSAVLAVGIVLIVFGGVVGQVLARFVFPWFVRMGLRMVANREYPKSKEERHAKARAVQLIHPYTAGIEVVPALVCSAVTALISGNMLTAANGQNFLLAMGLALLQIAIGLITLGFVIYMIVVRVIAIKKIYGVSTGQAFSGPFLIYFFTYLALVIVCVIIGIWAAITFGHFPQDPSM